MIAPGLHLNSASTMIVTDLYRPFVRPGALDEECLRVSRWLVIGLIALGAVLSYQVQVRFGSVFEAFQTFLSFFQGALFSLLLFRMLTRGPRGPAAWRACWWASARRRS